MGSKILIGLVLLSSLFLFGGLKQSIFAQEEIDTYDTEIQIQQDGTFSVRETIGYDFGNESRHGIIRDLVTDIPNQEGKQFRVGVDAITVSDLQGKPYSFSTSRSGNALELKIGDPDVIVTGKKTYVIQYAIQGGLRYFADHDELYWNVIGANWEVPISRATTSVTLPSGVELEDVSYSCYVGSQQSKDVARCSIAQTGSTLTYATVYLAPAEGMTIVARFPKGAVAILEPEPVVSFFDTLAGKIVIGLIVFISLFWYIAYPLWLPLKWYMHGRDPQRVGEGEAQAWFDPPKVHGRDLTAFETGALIDEHINIREFTALIIQLAQKGYLKIVEKEKEEFELIKTKDVGGGDQLQEFENLFITTLFQAKTHVRIKDNVSSLVTLIPKLEKMTYESLVKDGFFPKNPDGIRKYYAMIIGLATISFNLPLIISAGIFGRIMPKKTLEGVRGAMVAKSLKNFLSSQERQLEFQADKQMMFEKLLPFAIAFGVEKIWAKRFEGLDLKQPDWYQSEDGRSFTAGALAGSIHSSFSPALSRATATATTSTSGFSSGMSGGSVGGGGGGGGGRSW